MRGAAQKQRTALGNIAESGQAVPHAGPVLPRVAFSYLPGEPCLPEWENARVGQETPQSPRIRRKRCRLSQANHIGRVHPHGTLSDLLRTNDPGGFCVPETGNRDPGGQAEGIGGTGVSAGKDVCLKGWTFQAVQGIVVSQCSERFDPKEDERQCQT